MDSSFIHPTNIMSSKQSIKRWEKKTGKVFITGMEGDSNIQKAVSQISKKELDILRKIVNRNDKSIH